MSVVDLLRFSLRAVRGARLRSVLSLLGVAIGVAAVVLLTALGEGARRYVVAQFSNIGTNLLVVIPGRTETTGAMPGVVGVPNDLTLDDAMAIERSLRLTRRVAPIVMATDVVAFGERRRQVAIIGTSSTYLPIRQLEMGRGRFLPAGELQRGSATVVLGHTVAQELFRGEEPVGAVLRVGGFRMRVIGVLQETGTQMGVDMDEIVMVPAATALRMFNRSSLFRVLVEANSLEQLESARAAVRELMIQRHGEEDFTVLTEDSVVETFSAILNALTLALAAIAAVSLSVAGLGIMNVMLVSVSERTSEIGLLRAVGVSQRQVMAAFLAESVFLAAFGGLVGLAVGWGGVGLMLRLFPDFPASPPLWAVLSALTTALAVGAVFGLLPARRAARLDPVLALGRK